MAGRGIAALIVVGVVAFAVLCVDEATDLGVVDVVSAPAAAAAPVAPGGVVEVDGGPARVAPGPPGKLAVHDDTATTSDVEVLVRHPDGAPARGALARVSSGREWLAVGMSDRDGRAVFDALDVSDGLAVHVGGATVGTHVQRFETVDGPLVVTLPDGAEVSGVVRVDGDPVDDDLFVALRPKTTGLFGMEVVPEAEGFTTRTIDGRFRITGATAGKPYHLMFPPDFRTLDGDDTLVVEAPATDLVVDLEEQPLVRVRLVDEAGRPVAGATATLELGDRFSMMVRNAPPVSGRDGFVEWRPFTNASAPTTSGVIDARAGDLRGRLTVEELHSTRINDLRDLVLAPGRTLELFVEDALGEPVVGARARVTTEAARSAWTWSIEEDDLSPPSDADGRLALGPLLDDDAWIDVVSLRHAVRTVAVPPEDVDGMVVTFAPCATLDVVCDVEDPASLDGLSVLLEADSAAVADPLGVAMRAAFGGPQPTSWSSERYVFPARECLEFVDATPSVPIEVSLLRGHEDVLWGPQTATLAPGERRRVQIAYDPADLGPVWTLRGRVVASDGESPGSVEVRVLTKEPRNTTHMLMGGFFGGSTFDIDGVRGERVEVEIDGDEIVDRRVWVERTDERVEFVVERGVEVVVHVVDSSGEPVGGLRVSAHTEDRGEVAAAGSTFGARPPYRLDGVPAEPVTLEIEGLGRTWNVEHDASSPRADVVLDGVGSLALTWSDVTGERVLVAATDPETGDHAWMYHVDTDDLVAGRTVLDAVAVGRYSVRLHGLFDSAFLTAPRIIEVAEGRNEASLTARND